MAKQPRSDEPVKPAKVEAEKPVGHKEVLPDGKVKTYHGDGIFSIDN